MTLRRPHGHATKTTEPYAICDGCGFLFSHSDLRWRQDFRGGRLTNLRLLVCKACLDKPQEQLRLLIIPQDPDPVIDARPEFYAIDEA